MKIRDYNLIKQISQQHSVALLSLLYSPDEIESVAQLKAHCETVDYVLMRPRSGRENVSHLWSQLVHRRPLATAPFYYQEMAEKIRRAVTTKQVDIVQIEHSFLAPYVSAIPRGVGCKTVLSLHNLGVRQYARMRHLKMNPKEKALFWLKWLAMLGWEAKSAGHFDHIIAVSALEGDLIARANPNLRVAVIPNGCDAQALRPLPESSDGQTLLYVGTLGYPPHVDAVLHFAETTLPLIRQQIPDVRFVVVGHRPPPAVQQLAARGEITMAGSVADVVPFYQQAKVCVVPLRAGGGTRLKILEAMALGRPVVSTTVGSEGLEVKDGEHLMIADAPADFAHRVIQLLRDDELRHRLCQNGRRLVEGRYDWSAISEQLLQVYDQLAREGVSQSSVASII